MKIYDIVIVFLCILQIFGIIIIRLQSRNLITKSKLRDEETKQRDYINLKNNKENNHFYKLTMRYILPLVIKKLEKKEDYEAADEALKILNSINKDLNK